IVLKGVPLELITLDGVSWITTQIGTPINKFVRDGLDIKVCVVKDVSEDIQSEIVVDLEKNEIDVIKVEVPTVRADKKPDKE
ncbi:hypothetical protein LINPERPRIM_LOCUS25423, partial [Linum perenne]